MSARKAMIISVVGGLVIALLTGLISRTPPMLMGATWYGYPLAWLFRLVLAPEYFPWRVDVLALVGDVVAWAMVVGVVLFILTAVKRATQQTATHASCQAP